MYTRQLPLFFCLLAGVAYAIDCYHGTVSPYTLMEGPCNNTATMCYKTTSSSGETFGCDDGKTMCANAVNRFNCFNMSGIQTCCCNSMLCNPPSKPASMSILPMALIGVISFVFTSA